MRRRLIIGTRASELALWQTRWVASRLLEAFPDLQVVEEVIKTTGDKILDSALSTIGDKGLFTKEIEMALLDGKIDLAVHSMKDVPTNLVDGLTIGAISVREDVRDVFISHPQKNHPTLWDLPVGATIATGSLRRRSQLLHRRPDFRIVDLRGNLSTRRRKLEHSEWDGIILACAGVKRLGWENLVSEMLPPDQMLPAVGQGALAMEIRTGDSASIDLIRTLHDERTAAAVVAERALLRRLEGGCQIPVGAFGRVEGEDIVLDAMVGSLAGERVIRGADRGADANEVGTRLADTLWSQGADAILKEIRKHQSP